MEYRREVAIRCDGEDFVIALQPEDPEDEVKERRDQCIAFATQYEEVAE
jgi:hypothetical protein